MEERTWKRVADRAGLVILAAIMEASPRQLEVFAETFRELHRITYPQSPLIVEVTDAQTLPDDTLPGTQHS